MNLNGRNSGGTGGTGGTITRPGTTNANQNQPVAKRLEKNYSAPGGKQQSPNHQQQKQKKQ